MSDFAVKSDHDRLADIVRECELQIARQEAQLDGLSKVIEALAKNMRAMNKSIKALKRTSYIILGAFNALCLTATVIAFFIIYKEQVSHILISINGHISTQYYAEEADGVQIN
jgi:hypothetical protein